MRGSRSSASSRAAAASRPAQLCQDVRGRRRADGTVRLPGELIVLGGGGERLLEAPFPDAAITLEPYQAAPVSLRPASCHGVGDLGFGQRPFGYEGPVQLPVPKVVSKPGACREVLAAMCLVEQLASHCHFAALKRPHRAKQEEVRAPPVRIPGRDGLVQVTAPVPCDDGADLEKDRPQPGQAYSDCCAVATLELRLECTGLLPDRLLVTLQRGIRDGEVTRYSGGRIG